MREEKTAVKQTGNGSRGPVLAAIDLGTNACRLLIAVPGDKGPRVIGSFSATVRLGEGLTSGGTLSEAALDRTVEALKTCALHMRRHSVTHTRAIATEACRQAANTEHLIARARDEAGIDLIVVSAAEEAQLAVSGCADLIGHEFDGALVFDIGGGSTELILVRRANGHAQVVTWQSLPIGVASLAARHGGCNLAPAAYAPMREEMLSLIAPARAELGSPEADRFHLLGTSGTLTTLMGAKLGLPRYDRRQIDGQWLERAEAEALIERVAAAEFSERATMSCIGTDRADFILPGCAILSAIMAHWPCGRLRVADRGLREGLLTQLMHEARA